LLSRHQKTKEISKNPKSQLGQRDAQKSTTKFESFERSSPVKDLLIRAKKEEEALSYQSKEVVEPLRFNHQPHQPLRLTPLCSQYLVEATKSSYQENEIVFYMSPKIVLKRYDIADSKQPLKGVACFPPALIQ